MVEYESACNDCPECKGCGRKYKKYPVFTCDSCGDGIDDDEIYEGPKGEMLCKDCILKTLDKINPEQYYE